MSAQRATVAPLRREHLPQVRPLLEDPAMSCFAEARLFPLPGEPGTPSPPSGLGYWVEGQLRSVCLLGANLVPVAAGPDAVEAFADALRRTGRRASSILGPAEAVLALWERLEPAWGRAREVRPVQPMLAIAVGPQCEPDPYVRPVLPGQLDAYLPASVAMFTEEVGIDPRAGGMELLYRQRVAGLIAHGRALARWYEGRVVFKAELGAVSPRAVQVQGVWVAPQYRGRGLSIGGMASVVAHGLQVAPMVTLYVNDYNAPALAAYRRVGFEQVGTFATVLF
jgi:predicted GNAT family acetyltransferase